MPSYTVDGKGHRTLALLETGPATLEAIRDHAGATGFERKAYWHVLTALLDDGLVAPCGGAYRLTEAGEEALAGLRLGEPWGVSSVGPNVRLFVGVGA